MSRLTRSPADRFLDSVEALLWLCLVAFGGAVGLAALREAGALPDREALAPPAGLVEAEALPVRGQSGDFDLWLQPTDSFTAGRWSGEGHLFAVRPHDGDWVDLALPPREAGRYRLELFLTRARDYGVVAPSLNGVRVGPEIDLFSYAVEPTGAIDLGIVELGGDDVLRLEIVGANPRADAPHFQFGIDGLRISRAE